MTEQTLSPEAPARVGSPPRAPGGPALFLALIPLVLLAAVVVLIVRTNAGLGPNTLPPIETLSVQSVRLPAPGEIVVTVVNDGPDPITIAQVQVDDAYWQFTAEPSSPLSRLQTATITIPYPWVEDEAHSIALLSSTGVLFEAEVPVAVESPAMDQDNLLRFALVGIYVGVIPVALGLLWYPFLRRLGQGGMSFVLALTIGLLGFLVVDMWGAAQQTAAQAAGALNAIVLIPLLAALTAALLTLIGQAIRRGSTQASGLPLAYNIAFGIGLHNLGEGLAIGAAFAIGEVALGVFLILGFTLHNVTEGIGIASPLVRDRPALPHFLGLALVAGGPAVLGTWIGAFVYSPFWTTIFLAVGIGAILQVIVEIGRLIWTGQRRHQEPLVTWMTFGGVTAGIVVMYLTALLVAA